MPGLLYNFWDLNTGPHDGGTSTLNCWDNLYSPPFLQGGGCCCFCFLEIMVSCDATRPWIPDLLTTTCWNHGVRQQTWPTLHPFLVSTHPPSPRDFKKNKPHIHTVAWASPHAIGTMLSTFYKCKLKTASLRKEQGCPLNPSSRPRDQKPLCPVRKPTSWYTHAR